MKLSTKHILLAFQLMTALTAVSSFSQRPPSNRFRKDVDDMSFQEIQKIVTEMGYEVGTHDRAGLLMIAKGFPAAVRARKIGEQPAVRNVRGWNVSTSQANPQPASHRDGMAMVPYSPPQPSQARQQQPIYQNIGPNSAYAQGDSQPKNRDVNVVKNSTAGQPSAWKNDVYGNLPGQRDLQTFTRGPPSGNTRGNQNESTAQNNNSAQRVQRKQQPMQRNSNLSAYGDNLNSPRYRGTGGISDLSA
ncbi:predicted protein [Chaetoceros tenuissimus]|uniref:Uncharacterized protein n=1 Tax=Chaetoceros tenuissimus TaxID=426638 RepID=A0AAD3GZ32_9STRA|nr:predicted protein [Chaetoceros tenuissimus]